MTETLTRKSPRELYIDECRAFGEQFRKEKKPWVCIVRDDTCNPVDRQAREQRDRGMAHKVGRGKPIGVAVVWVVEHGAIRTIHYGAAVCARRDKFDRHIGLRKAVSHAMFGYSEVVDPARFFENVRAFDLVADAPTSARLVLGTMIQKVIADLAKRDAAEEAAAVEAADTEPGGEPGQG